MPTVQKFDSNMIERHLRARNLKFLRDSDGDFRVDFAYSDETGCELTMWLICSGSQKTIYDVLVLADKRIPKSEWGRAIMMCNTWNTEKRWPKAYLRVANPNTDTTGVIQLECQIDLEQGIHQELFDDFTLTTWSAAIQFWTWAHKEQGM